MSSEELLNKLPNADVKAQFSAADYAEGKVDDKRLNEAVLTPQEERYSRETKLRENLTTAFTMIITLWLLSVVLILVGNNLRYKLSDEVLIALLVTSTANVIGMMLIILKNLFPNRDSK